MRRKVIATTLLLGSAFLAVPMAGDVILHPNGFGEHSYAAWKAHQGLIDETGNKNQALYFQKMTSTPTFAAGVATFQGIEGLPANQLTGLSFFWRMDGHCGAGAPRFNVRLKPAAGPSQTIFIGCAAMAPGIVFQDPNDNSRTYQQKSIVAPFAALPSSTIITSLSIVFDEGDDVGPGFVYLDNITVNTTNGGTKIWTSASDNGNE